MNKAHSKTTFDTNPVESLEGAIINFTAAFSNLQKELEQGDFKSLADNLKETLYKPVYPKNETAPISVFEIGIMYVPKNNGEYSVNEEKLSLALKTRKNEIKALFTQCDGLICDIIRQMDILAENEDETLAMAANTQLNECFRLRAMF